MARIVQIPCLGNVSWPRVRGRPFAAIMCDLGAGSHRAGRPLLTSLLFALRAGWISGPGGTVFDNVQGFPAVDQLPVIAGQHERLIA